MHVIAQGTAGAGKTTTLHALEAAFSPEALYIPELQLPFPDQPTDEYFFANDRAKQQLAQTATLALMDRDELSTLAWIGSRDGLTSPTYRNAYAMHRDNLETSQAPAADVYFHFSVPFGVSTERQANGNHPLWRQKRFADFYEKSLRELIAEFVPSPTLTPIDGTLSPNEVFQACQARIWQAQAPSQNQVPDETPYINYQPRSFVAQERYDILRAPLACVVLKPDCLERGLTDTVLGNLEGQGVRIIAQRTKHLSNIDVQQLWPTFWTESWWQETRNYMRSGPSIGLLCSLGETGISGYDELVNAKREIRKQHQDPAETRKCVSVLHASDSYEETARNVLAFWSQDEVHNILKETA